MRRLKYLLASVLMVSLVLLTSNLALAFNPLSGVCQSSNTGGGTNPSSSPVCQQNATQVNNGTDPLLAKIHDAIDIIALIAGGSAVVIIMYSAYMFVTAGGAVAGQRAGDNANRARQARGTLTNALVGLVLVALAWTIVTYVADKLIKT